MPMIAKALIAIPAIAVRLKLEELLAALVGTEETLSTRA